MPASKKESTRSGELQVAHTTQLLVTAGQNIDRIRSEAAFAHLCGVDPIPASSGKTVRHRLNPGGDRGANSALHMIAVVRLRYCERTRANAPVRTQPGASRKASARRRSSAASSVTSRGRSTGACERISLRSPRLDIYRNVYRNVRVNFTSKPNPT